MRILVVVHRYPVKGGAGAENYSRQLCDELARNHEILVVTRSEVFQGEYCETCDINGFPYPVIAFVKHTRDTDRLDKNYWNPDLDAAFSHICQSFQPDVVHFQHCISLSTSMVSCAARLEIPVFFTLHDYWFICPDIIMLDSQGKPCSDWSSDGRCRNCLFRKSPGPKILIQGKKYIHTRRKRMHDALMKCKKILVPSLPLQRTIIDFGIPASRTQYWPHGIAQDWIVHRKKFKTPLHSPIRIGYIGTFAYQKGVDLLLQAFKSLDEPNAELHLYGDIERDSETRQRVRGWRNEINSESIQFKGSFQPDQLGEIHRNLDLIVVPSRWYENRPLSILEAFSAGNPVLGSDFAGVADLLSDLGAEWRFTLDNWEDLANKLRMLLANPGKIRAARDLLPRILSMREEIDQLFMVYNERDASISF